ncbi:hypothetical protein [Streptomyces xanthophaeus]|uniref:Uncharacterized protein n=1 Tax=Streptomyces xanthophaeus TaxID=67385 RepID=A0A919H974_9ACTN|nr:hypothetical protein [Streptomyces xanthophaeus]GHI89874.1 hypothetical protein Sxan_72380 [Streptomyces xanthophaeus]
MAQQTLIERLLDVLARLIGQRTVRCPDPSCGVRIRYRNVTPDEAKRLGAMATDHGRHNSGR